MTVMAETKRFDQGAVQTEIGSDMQSDHTIDHERRRSYEPKLGVIHEVYCSSLHVSQGD